MIGKTMIAALLLGAGPVVASQPAPSLRHHAAGAEETRIPEMSRYLEAIPDPHRGTYIRAVNGRWYYARVLENCPRLTRNAALRFEPSPGGYFDHNSALRADGWRCLVASVTLSDPPPSARRH